MCMKSFQAMLKTVFTLIIKSIIRAVVKWKEIYSSED